MTETRPPHFGWKAEYLKLSKEVEPIPRFFALPNGASQIYEEIQDYWDINGYMMINSE